MMQLKRNTYVLACLMSLGLSSVGQNETYTFENQQFRGITYDVFMVRITEDNLSRFSVFRNQNQTYHSQLNEFDNFSNSSVFAVNLSIVDEDCDPLGWYVENGAENQQINLSSGTGNFYIEPNGILFFTKDEAFIGPSRQLSQWNQSLNPIAFGIQSGPLLLSQGKISKSLNPNSKSQFIRSGVALLDKQGSRYLLFCTTSTAINFYDFASIFLDKYSAQDALCLESAGCLMKLPYIDDNPTSLNDGVVCNYLTFE